MSFDREKTAEPGAPGRLTMMRAVALGTLILFSVLLAVLAGEAASRRIVSSAAAPPPRKTPSDILDGDEGPTNPKVGTVPTLPGACPILGACALPGDETRATAVQARE